jgi:hypothetical protein
VPDYDYREPDYSEFPTTPTGWQERALADWQTVTPLETEDADRTARRRVDVVALVAGVVFVLFAVLGLSGVSLDDGLFADGGVLWLVLIAGGAALLVSELRRARRGGRAG